MEKLTERYSCGHRRTKKGKHACPKCRAKREAVYRRKHVPQAVASEKRRKASLARIEKALKDTEGMSLSDIGAKLGVTRQRIFQLLRWREKQLHKAAG